MSCGMSKLGGSRDAVFSAEGEIKKRNTPFELLVMRQPL